MKPILAPLRASLFSIAVAAACSLALGACGGDDDDNPSTQGSGGRSGSGTGGTGTGGTGTGGTGTGGTGTGGTGTGGTGTGGTGTGGTGTGGTGTGGSGTGGSGTGGSGTGGSGDACEASAGLARPAEIACSKLYWRCEATVFSLPNTFQSGIKAVELRGDFAEGAWNKGVPMALVGDKWEVSLPDAPYGNIEYKFYVTHDGKPNGEWYADPNNPKQVGQFGNSLLENQCATPICPATIPPPGCTPEGARADGAWDWRDTVMYFPFVDRFMNGDTGNDDPLESGLPGGGLVAAPGNYQGGDYAGLKKKLDEGYFDQLGVNTLWLTVPFDNPDDFVSFADRDKFTEGQPGYYEYTGYHGYWPMDQWPEKQDGVNRTEERFGTEAELEALVDAAHAKGMKVLFDYAMVHLHESSPLYAQHPDWFTPKYAVNDQGFYIDANQDTIKDGDGLPINYRNFTGDPSLLPGAVECICGRDPYCGWNGGDSNKDNAKAGERCWFQGYLPHVDYTNEAAREHSLAAAVRLATEMKADGYRLDAVKHIDESWYIEARTRLEALNANERFYLVGETFDYGSRDNIKRFVSPEKLDGQFDFPGRAALASAVLARHSKMSDLARFMESNDAFYEQTNGGTCYAVMSPFVGNHDMGRAIHVAENTPRWDAYADGIPNAWLNTPNQADVSDEAYERMANAFAVLMTNRGAVLIYYGDEVGLAGGGDPDNRRMLFNPDGSEVTPLVPAQVALRERLGRLGAIRKEHPSLRRGLRTTLNFSDDVWVYKMALPDGSDEVLVAVNRGDTAQTICDLPSGVALTELVTQQDATGPSATLPPRQARMYVKKPLPEGR
ncbi:MAG TPA: alpha-amylase family glycosyl hydrolase [Polyangiaceae bacterium]|nr:alpha-amylase family glycosyl hydrolase [Polyangiaceae bacterium]